MSLVVKKFGGTSVANIERIEFIAEQLSKFYQENKKIVIVVSAMKGETDNLENLAYKISKHPDPREMAAVLATGEQLVIALLAMALIKRGCPARSYTGLQIGIETEGIATKSRITSINTNNIYKDLNEDRIVIVAGFQGVDNVNGDITTLGRGGSDTTAVALSIALKAEECHIYTDVDGVFAADPNIISSAKKLNSINFTEMLELSGLGAKVMQIRAVELGSYYNLPIRVLSSFKDLDLKEDGTLITSNSLDYPQVIKIAILKEQIKISIPKIEQNDFNFILKKCAELQIEIDLLSVEYNDEDKNYKISFVVDYKHLGQCKNIFKQINERDDCAKNHFSHNKTNNCDHDFMMKIDYHKVAKLSLVGLGLLSNPDILYKIYTSLDTANIHIKKIVSAETKVSILLNEIDLEPAVNVLHSAFFENNTENLANKELLLNNSN